MKKVATKKEEKYVTEKTFEKSMAAVAKSFTSVQEQIKKVSEKMDGGFKRHDKMFELVLNELKGYAEERKDFRKNISNLYSDTNRNERDIDNLKSRVEKIEIKLR